MIRIERIRKRVFQNIPQISIERARLITEAYRRHEAEPVVLKTAKALDMVLRNAPIEIFEDELIVGSQTELSRGAALFPEYTWKWIHDELDTFQTRPVDRFTITEENKAKLRSFLPYWEGKTVTEKIDAAMSGFDDIADSLDAGMLICRRGRSGTGHIIPHYEKILKTGLVGVLKAAEEHLDRLDYTDPEDEKKIFFLKATIIAANAAIAYATRYADKARALAESETDPRRKRELYSIAGDCLDVPANPAKTFRQAIQSLWFLHLITQIESHGHSISMGRLDTHLWPYYSKDIEDGTLTREDALELISCLWLKMSELVKVRSRDHASVHAGYPLYQGVTLGGQDAEGKDVINDISHLCLEATKILKLPQPTLMIRVHSQSPREFLRKAHEVSALGLGIPVYTNDDVAVQAMLTRGILLRDALSYGLVGCWEIQPQGMSETAPYGGYINMAKCLEIVLNGGRDPGTGRMIAEDQAELCSFNGLMDSFSALVVKAVKQLVIINNMGDYCLKDVAPLPFLSCLVDDCVEKGKPLIEGGARYNFTSLHAPGIATVADSLAALKKLVFEEEKITLAELKDALGKNFTGFEKIQQVLVHQAPKYGNDVDYVDQIARHVAELFSTEVEKYPNTRGGKCWPGLWGSENSIPMGAVVGATPDGRKAFTPLADGCSPSQGRDSHGPTAVIKSASKIDHILGGADGTQLNIKFSPALFESDHGLEKLGALTRAYFKLRGESICYFVISSDLLKEAQASPEQYENLVVRVAGYSAFFTDLSRNIQDDLIARTEHSL